MSDAPGQRSISMDGYQMTFPGTGLSVASAEILRAFSDLDECARVVVFLPKTVNLSSFGLSRPKIVPHVVEYSPSRIDYVSRWRWGRAVARASRKLDRGPLPHYIPYLFNYGAKSSNTVVVPDLAYRLYPDYGQRRPGQAFWDPRGRLPIRPLVRKLEERAVAAARKLVTYSAFVRDHAAEVFARPPDSFRVVPLAASPFFSAAPDPAALAVFKDKHSLPPRFVLYVGGYAVRKNIPNLLRACGQARAACPDFLCAFVGLADPSIRARPDISALLDDPAVAASVIALPRLTDDEVRLAYHACSFAVYPSMNEGFGLPILEAAAAGRLSLCGDNSSLREIQTDASCRFDAANPSAIAACMGKFWKNPAALTSATSATSAINDRYSWQRTAAGTWRCIFDQPAG